MLLLYKTKTTKSEKQGCNSIKHLAGRGTEKALKSLQDLDGHFLAGNILF
jgi:hypothetical protein